MEPAVGRVRAALVEVRLLDGRVGDLGRAPFGVLHLKSARDYALRGYDALRAAFAAGGTADYFTAHGGHGLGISHSEPPHIVRRSTETLVNGAVVTLEPGLAWTACAGCASNTTTSSPTPAANT